jgi:hypothetical protein
MAKNGDGPKTANLHLFRRNKVGLAEKPAIVQEVRVRTMLRLGAAPEKCIIAGIPVAAVLLA